MAIRPITFSGPMIQAILEGRKTQTRRVLSPQIVCHASEIPTFTWGKWSGLFPDDWFGYGNEIDGHLPYIPGDRLWVREAWVQIEGPDGVKHEGSYLYRADARDNSGTRWSSVVPGDPDHEVKWRSPIHMPRSASRIILLVTDVRVQRLQEISEADAEAEGVKPILVPPDGGGSPHIEGFLALWDSLHTKSGHTWDTNPWVAAISFEPIFKNIDKVGK